MNFNYKKPAGNNFCRWDILPLFFLLLCCGLCIWRIPYGICGPDEALYLSIPYRLLQGDRLLMHEWQLSQLSSLLLLPLMRIHLLSGSSEGMVLSFRCFFVFFHALSCFFIYSKAKKLSRLGACLAAAQLMVFAPINIANFSYYIMGIDLLAIMFVSLAVPVEGRLPAFGCGFLFGCAVLCNPFYFVLFPLYSLAVLCLRRRLSYPCIKGEFWCFFTLGGAVIAGILFTKLFWNADFSILAETLRLVLYTDAEHPSLSLYGLLYETFSSFRKSRFFLHTIVGAVLLSAIFFLDKKKAGHRHFYYAGAALLSMIFTQGFYLEGNNAISVYMFPVSIAGFLIWLFSENRHNRVFYCIYLPGMLCWFCSTAASNLGYYTLSSVSAITMIASMIMIGREFEACIHGKTVQRSVAALMLLAVLLPFCAIAACRAFTVFPALPIADCTEIIQQGSQRGLIVSPVEKARYELIFEQTNSIREEGSGPVAYFSDINTMYLDDSKRCAVFSAWFPINYLSENLPRLEEYWALFPDRIPETVFISSGDEQSDRILEEFFLKKGYSMQKVSDDILIMRR